MTTIITLQPVSGHEMRRRTVDDSLTVKEMRRMKSLRQSGYAVTNGRIVRVIRCVKGGVPEPSERYIKMLAREVAKDRVETR